MNNAYFLEKVIISNNHELLIQFSPIAFNDEIVKKYFKQSDIYGGD